MNIWGVPRIDHEEKLKFFKKNEIANLDNKPLSWICLIHLIGDEPSLQVLRRIGCRIFLNVELPSLVLCLPSHIYTYYSTQISTRRTTHYTRPNSHITPSKTNISGQLNTTYAHHTI